MIRLARILRPVVAFFLEGRWGILLIGALLAVATALAGSALLGISGWFITATAVAGFMPETAISFNVFAPSASIRFLALARTACRYGERLMTHDATLAVLAAMRERIFRGFASERAAATLQMRPARLLFRLTVDVDSLDSFYLRLIVPVFAAFWVVAATWLILSTMDRGLADAIGVLLALAGFSLPLAGALAARRPARRKAYALEGLRSRVIDLVAGQTDLLMSGRLAAQVRGVLAAEDAVRDADNALNRVETLMTAGFMVASTLFLTGALVAVSLLVEGGVIDAPAAALALLLVFVALEPFGPLQRGAMELSRSALAAQRLGPRLVPASPPSPHPLPPAGLAVVLDRVDIPPAANADIALKQVSLKLEDGGRLALIGSSGMGKTTLLRAVAGELSVRAGSIESIPATLLTQKTELFQDTLRENLRLANPDADDAALLSALETAGLADVVRGLPAGLETRLGEGGLGLSAGQARRLSLARLFLRPTRLWLLDEPTEGLDRETAEDVAVRLSERLDGRTLIISTHIRREAELAERLIYIKNREISAPIFRGTPEFDRILNGLRHN
ncbi:MAG: ATP-binding cassette domain-containing protein [Methylobacteriaceae bacterium]|jgi:ATP-binding cassette subfamily C protein CydC|nr:ATP-binding cassette domain-containing protein [Methylobacteriaceae bacterium]